MKVQYNNDNDELFCIECKQRINIGEKFIIVQEKIYGDEIVKKEFHPQCLPEMEE